VRELVAQPLIVPGQFPMRRRPAAGSTLGLRLGINPDCHPLADTAGRARRHAEGMNNISMYLINASLIFLVIRQIREHPLDARSLATPVLAVGAAAVGAAAVLFLHSVPAGGSDLVLEAACVAAGAAMGAFGGLATSCAWTPTAGRWAGPASWRPACGSAAWAAGWRSRSRRATARARPSPGSAWRITSPARRPGWRRW
jgi:hypothetical protein